MAAPLCQTGPSDIVSEDLLVDARSAYCKGEFITSDVDEMGTTIHGSEGASTREESPGCSSDGCGDDLVHEFQTASTYKDDIGDDDDEAFLFFDSLECVVSQWVCEDSETQAGSVFHWRHDEPQPSICNYLAALASRFHCSEACLVLALVYINRVVSSNREFEVSAATIHRILLASVLAAIKFQDDFRYRNSDYAKFAGVTTQEINAIEKQFVSLLNWRLHVTVEEYQYYKDVLP